MNKTSKITASELVLSAIFFLQQNNGVTAKDITKFICEKRGCRQSHVRSEVKKALERATENGIFSKKRGLYRIESGFGRNKISIKVRGTPRNKKMKRMRQSSSLRKAEEMKDAVGPVYTPVMDIPAVPSFSRKRSSTKHSHAHAIMVSDDTVRNTSGKRVTVDPTGYSMNGFDDDDEDDDEDFLEEDDDDDEIDYFADDQFPKASDAVKEYSEPEEDPKKDVAKRKVQSRSKSRTKGRTKRRKASKPKRKTWKRKRAAAGGRRSQKKPRAPEQTFISDDEYQEGEDDENQRGQSHDCDGDDDDMDTQGSEEENQYDENDYENYQEKGDYDYGQEDYLTDDEYGNQQHESKEKLQEQHKSENNDGPKTEEGGQKGKATPPVTTNVTRVQQNKPEGKVTSDSAPATPVTQQEHSPQDRKSKQIRSSSLFRSFKKKNDSRISCVDRKQINSRM